MRKFWTFAVSGAMVIGALFGYVAAATSGPEQADRVNITGVYCPTEDSCMADYDGELDTWVIYEIIP